MNFLHNSESHIHSFINVLRYGNYGGTLDLPIWYSVLIYPIRTPCLSTN